MNTRGAALAALCLLGVVAPAGAVVNPPVQKWQQNCGGGCQTGWYSSPAVKDLDNDGQPEVIWGAYTVYVLRGTDGVIRASASAADHQRVWPGVAVADLSGDGTQEIVVGRGQNQLHVYRFVPPATTLQTVWMRNPFANNCAGNNCEVRTLAVEDLESDGSLEVVVGRASGGSFEQLNAYDANGNQRPGWPARRNGEVGFGWGMYNENVTIGDLNGDGFKEVIGPTDTHYITALDRNGNQLPTNAIYNAFNPVGPKPWSRVGVHVDHAVDLRGFANCGIEHRPNFANSAPAIADLNGDGVREIVVPGNVYNCGTDPYTDLYYMPFLFRMDRSRWSGSGFDWTVLPAPGPGSAPLSQDYNVIETAEPNPVLADLDNDGRLEILVPSYDGRLHAWWLDKTEHGSWPFDVPGSGIRFASEPAVADLDNDGQAEVIFTSWGQKAGNTLGQLHIVSSQGVQLHAVNLPTPSSAVWNGGLAAPTLANIDGDADLEAVVGTSRTGAVAYDLPGTANARVLWGTGRHNLQRTGAVPVVPPAVSIADLTIAEQHQGTWPAGFTVALSKPSAVPVTVAFATAAGTATAGSDFLSASGVVTFPPGAVARAATVPVVGDLIDEPNETFTVTLSAPSGATIGDGQAVGTIQDDDAPPNLAASDCAVPEGNAGTTPCSFAVTLSSPSAFPVTVSYFTLSGTAVSGSDFTAVSGAISLAPGQAGPVTVAPSVLGDAAVEQDESFTLVLQNAVNAALPGAPPVGTILDDDAPSPGTDELFHGWSQTGDLQVAPDVYRLLQAPFASYEAILDAVTGDAPVTPMLERIAADNATVLQVAPVGGGSHRMAWRNDLPTAVSTQSLRVADGGCPVACGPDDVYRIRLYETTGTISRFNNSGSQLTVLSIQNPAYLGANARAYFWSASGALLHVHPFALAPHALFVLNLQSVPALAGRSGSITIASDAPHGVLRGKAVAVEPATGYSFDEVMQPRPR